MTENRYIEHSDPWPGKSPQPRNTLSQASQPQNPALLPVVVALNDASFDVLSWPINSVQQRLKERINETRDSLHGKEREYMVTLKLRINSIFVYDRVEISKQLRGLAALVFEGRPLG